MRDELRAAAGRLLTRRHAEPLSDDFGEAMVRARQFWDDADALAKAWLSEHPADDGEPVTEDWLRAVGFVESPNGNWLWLPGSTTGPKNGLARHKADVSLWQVIEMIADDDCENVEVPALKTRGDLRRLAAALGVELKEPTP